MPRNPTRLHRRIDEKLAANGHSPLDLLVLRHRSHGLSWRAIAAEITIASGEPCSETNLIRWFGQ
jgi:intein-encoded DNA endonuclease-like protein